MASRVVPGVGSPRSGPKSLGVDSPRSGRKLGGVDSPRSGRAPLVVPSPRSGRASPALTTELLDNLPGGGLAGSPGGGSNPNMAKSMLGRLGGSDSTLRPSSSRRLLKVSGPTPVQRMAFGDVSVGVGLASVADNQRSLRDFRARFDYFLVLLTVLESFWVPMRVGFDIHHAGYWLIVDVLVDVMFALDMALHFVTPTFIKGVLVTDRAQIRADYMAFAYPSFALDLAATLPLDLLLLGVVQHGTRGSAMLRCNRLLRINKLLHMFRTYEEDMTVNTSVVQLIKCVLGVFFLAHLIGCSWFLIASLEGWPDNGWVPGPDVLARSITEQYIESLLWAFNGIYHPAYIGSTFPPDTLTEHVFTLCVMLVGIFMFASIVGFTSTLILNLDASASAYRAKMDSIARYCKNRNVTIELRERIYNYCKYLWSRRNALNEEDALEDLPSFLREELASEINAEILSQVPLFEGCEEAFISALATKLHPMVATPGDVVVQQDSIGSEMYFISQGQVQVITELEDGTQVAQTTLSPGSYFGEIALLFEKKRTASVVALTYCDLFRLGKLDLDAVFEEFPNYRDIMCRIAELRFQMSTAAQEEGADGPESPKHANLHDLMQRAPSSLSDSVIADAARSSAPSADGGGGGGGGDTKEVDGGGGGGGGGDDDDDDDDDEEGVFLEPPTTSAPVSRRGSAIDRNAVNEMAELQARVAQLERGMADQRRVYAMQLDTLRRDFQAQLAALTSTPAT